MNIPTVNIKHRRKSSRARIGNQKITRTLISHSVRDRVVRMRLKVSSLCVTFDYHLLHDNPEIIANELKKEFSLNHEDLSYIKKEIHKLANSS